MACVTKIASDIAFDCENLPSTGLEVDVVLINREDIDLAASVTAIDGTQDIVLKSGTTGYRLEGVKQLNSKLFEVIVNDDSLNKVRHDFNGRIFNMTPANITYINALITGANLVAVVEKKSKGALNADAFEILGWKNGLEISAGTGNSAENDGAFVFTLSSSPLALENEAPRIYLDTDYATSKVKFDNAFIQA